MGARPPRYPRKANLGLGSSYFVARHVRTDVPVQLSEQLRLVWPGQGLPGDVRRAMQGNVGCS